MDQGMRIEDPEDRSMTSCSRYGRNCQGFPGLDQVSAELAKDHGQSRHNLSPDYHVMRIISRLPKKVQLCCKLSH